MSAISDYTAAIGNLAHAEFFLGLIGKEGHCKGELHSIDIDITIHWQEVGGSKNYWTLSTECAALRSALSSVIRNHFEQLAQEALEKLKSKVLEKKQAAMDEYKKLFNEAMD